MTQTVTLPHRWLLIAPCGCMRKFGPVEKWTPTTEAVREATGWGEAFDRWLDEHDHEVAKNAADEAHLEMEQYGDYWN